MIARTDLGLGLFPLAAAAIAAVFAGLLAVRFADRRRPHEGLWAMALFMYAAASLAMFLGVLDGWSPAEFRLYWLLGAVLNVPYLLAGEVYLLSRRRAVGHAVLAVLAVATMYAGWAIATADLDPSPLEESFPLGREVFGAGSIPHRLAQYYSWPAYILLLAGLVWSAMSMRRNPDLRARTAGVLGIALGATIVAVGSGVGAGFGIVPLFAGALAAGVAVMFWGFLAASRPAARPASRTAEAGS